MWTHQESIETAATPAQIWKLFSDVNGWKHWNAGIEDIEIYGSFAVGTMFSMRLPDGEMLTSTLVQVEENQGFTDETIVEDTRVLVHHQITRLASGATKISYCTEVTGSDAAELRAIVTGDFCDVLLALKTLAEKSS